MVDEEKVIEANQLNYSCIGNCDLVWVDNLEILLDFMRVEVQFVYSVQQRPRLPKFVLKNYNQIYLHIVHIRHVS